MANGKNKWDCYVSSNVSEGQRGAWGSRAGSCSDHCTDTVHLPLTLCIPTTSHSHAAPEHLELRPTCCHDCCCASPTSTSHYTLVIFLHGLIDIDRAVQKNEQYIQDVV